MPQEATRLGSDWSMRERLRGPQVRVRQGM